MESDLGKLFIGGISWDTNEERLRDYFKMFGEIKEAVIMKDRNTGRARGFGFVVFADPAVAERVVMEKHTLDGRVVEAKKAVPRDDQHNVCINSSSTHGSPGLSRTKKIFVGGLASTVTENDFKNYFDQFGTITDAVVMYDHNTQRPRGFGFITYDSEDSVDKVLMKTFHELNGKMVEVKRAVPKELSPAPTVRSPTGGQNLGLNRINNLFSGYAQGYNLSSLGVYGMRMDNRFGPISSGRGSLHPFSPVNYSMGMNFETGMNPSYAKDINYNNDLAYGHGLRPYNSGISTRYNGSMGYTRGNATMGVDFPSPFNELHNNGSRYNLTSTGSNGFISSASENLGGFGNGAVNWGISTSSMSTQTRSDSGYGSAVLGFGNTEDIYRDGGFGSISRNRRGNSSHITTSSAYEGTYADLYGGAGEENWQSGAPELVDSGPFTCAFGDATSDTANKSSASYNGNYNFTNRHSTREN